MVLISDSTSGKTRALYEALHVPACGDVGDAPQSLASAGWRVWPGTNPVPAQRFLAELPLVGPRTVIWLNDAQRYLVEPDEHTAQAIAAGLREVLTDPARTPVLVLGTLWPEYLDEIARRPPRGQPDRWADARALLVGNTHRVPDEFHSADLDAARANPDPLIQEGIAAADEAAGGRADRVLLTQYVAGVPALMDFYANATTTVRAVLHAAMDCRRLGHGEWLPVPLLHHAAPAYLDDRQRTEHLADPEWFAKALDALAARRPGGSRALHPPPVLPGGASDDVVKLEDFLDQLGRQTRRYEVPPQGFWGAVLDHAATPDDHHRLSVSAHRRQRLRIAHALARRAVEGESVDSLLWQAELCHETGNRDEAERLFRRAADLGDTSALNRLVYLRKETGDLSGAVEFALRAAAMGDTFPVRGVADMCVEVGAISEAEELLQRAVDLGDIGALVALASLRDDAGQHIDAVELAHAAAAKGNGLGLARLAIRRQRAGRRTEAQELARVAASVRHPMALTRLALMHYDIGEYDEAEKLLLRAIGMGYLKACMALADLRAWNGDRGGAEEILRHAVAAGDMACVHELLLLREKAGDHAEADALACRAAVTGDIRGLEHLIQIRMGTGLEAETEQVLRRAVDEGGIGALELLVDSRERAGDVREAQELARRAADAGVNGPLLRIARQHWSHDAHDRLARFGLEPNGSVSQPW